MSNSFTFKEQRIGIGDTVSMTYKFVEGEKERQQLFQGIIIKVKGANPENRMFTVRKISRSGVGIERIIPVTSPYLVDLKLIKRSNFHKSKLYFIRELSEQQVRSKLYQIKTVKKVHAKSAQPAARKAG